MKYYLMAGVAVLAGVAAVLIANQEAPQAANEAAPSWKYSAVESETKVRPAYFEQMKMEPGLEMRAPASKKKN